MVTKQTRLAAYKKIMTAIKAGVVRPSKMQSGCKYRKGARRCGVGALFSDAQLQDLQARGLNHRVIRNVAEVIGVKNIEYVTGMSLAELHAVQNKHDRCSAWLTGGDQEFREYIENTIEVLSV